MVSTQMAEQRQDGFIGWARRHPLLADLACLATIVVFALFLRGVYVAEYTSMSPLGQAAIGADVGEYDTAARQLLIAAPVGADTSIHAPLYPRFLATLYRMTNLQLPAVRHLQLALDVLALVLVWIAVRRQWRRRVACIAGLIWAGYLPLIYYSAELFSEGLVVFFISLALFLWSFLPTARRTRAALFVAVGVSLGLAAISHPLSLLFGLAVVALGPLLLPQPPNRRQHLIGSAWLALGLAIPIAPVSWHNSRLAGGFVLIQDRAGLNLYIGNNADADGTPNIPPGPDYQRLLDWPASEGIKGSRDAQKFYRKQALHFAGTHPIQQLGLLVRKFTLTWNAQEISSGSDLPVLQLYTRFMRLPFLPRFGWLAPLAILGIWLRRRERQARIWVLLPLVYTAALTLFVTCGRYRLPMMPGLILLAALALDALADAWSNQDLHTWRLATGTILIAAIPIYLVRPPVPRDHQARTGLLFAEAYWHQLQRQPPGEVRAKLLSSTEEFLSQLSLELRKAERQGAEPSPTWAEIHDMYGLCLGESGKHAEALNEHQLARELRPNDPQILVHYTTALVRNGQPKQARTLLEAALAGCPDQPILWYELGVMDQLAKQHSQARKAYAKALEHDPTLVSALLNLAVLHHQGDEPTEAEALYRRALRLDPLKARAHYGLAVLLAEGGDFAAATPHFRAAIVRQPRNEHFWETYRKMAENAGQTEEAEIIAKQAAAAMAPPPQPLEEKP